MCKALGVFIAKVVMRSHVRPPSLVRRIAFIILSSAYPRWAFTMCAAGNLLRVLIGVVSSHCWALAARPSAARKRVGYRRMFGQRWHCLAVHAGLRSAQQEAWSGEQEE